MTTIADERRRLIIKVSNLYYIEGLNQQEIAERLRISRPQVSRMLSAARAEGIVNISIKNPYAEEQKFERAIAETFGIHDVVVIDTAESDQKTVDRQLAGAAIALLESILKDNDTVGVMASRSVCAIGEEIEFFSRKGLSFVPLVGGWGPEGANWHANSNVRNLGEKLRSKYWQLNAPAVVASQQTRDALLNEPEISSVLEIAKNSTVALVGIGQVSDEAAIVKSGFFNINDIDEVKGNGAVANLCTSFLNEKGGCIDFTASPRMIGITADELREIPQVIACASGADKAKAITATLRGRWIDVLITNLSTAKEILEWHRLHPVI